jgi:hypothetical protein
MPVARDRGRLSDDSDDGKNGGGSAEKGDSGQSSVTLSGLLNAIDGVSSQVSLVPASGNIADAYLGRLGPLCINQSPRPARQRSQTTRSIRRLYRL